MSSNGPNGTTPDSALAKWLRTRSTAICWLVGPAGSGKSATIRASQKNAGSAVLLPLSAASPDRCFRQCLGVSTTKQLFDKLSTLAAELIVLDALDTVQDRDEANLGQVSDLRLRHLLSFVARAKGPVAQIVVTSRLTPPRDLPRSAITLIEFEAKPHAVEMKTSNPSGGPSVLEILASSRRAASDSLLGWLAGIPGYDSPTSTATVGNKPTGWLAWLVGRGATSGSTPVLRLLEQAIRAGVVDSVLISGSDWFQMADSARHQFLTEARASTVHLALAEKLESEEVRRHAQVWLEKDPELRHDLLERAIEHRLAAGDIPNAILCYWQQMGNFSQLDVDNAFHAGARVCRTIIQCQPRDVSEDFRQAPGAIAVLNDLATFARCLGDARSGINAAVAANGFPRTEMRPWDHSTLARHAAQAFLMRGELVEAMRWAEEAKRFAREGLRLYEGMPTHEIVTAYEHASHEIIRIAAAGNDANGAAAIISDLVVAHAHWTRRLGARPDSC